MLKVVGASWFQTRMSKMILGAVILIGIVAFLFGEIDGTENEDGKYAATVTYSDLVGIRINFWGQGNDPNKIPKGVARAFYQPDSSTTGWAKLDIQSQENAPDWIQAYAAGYLEGSLTWHMIYCHWMNTIDSFCLNNEDFCLKFRDFLEENERQVKSVAAKEKDDNPFWHQVYLFYMQLDGVENGWRKGVEESREEFDIPHSDFLWMNAVADLMGLHKLFNSNETNWLQSKAANLSSLFVKLLPETGQLFVSHNTGGMYQSMLRMLKRYELHYHKLPFKDSEPVIGEVLEFSSYPGAIHSQDDFYMVSKTSHSGKLHQMTLASIPLNNEMIEQREISDLQNKVLLGPLILAANRLALDGHSWAKIIVDSNGGIGNRHWAIVDYARLAPVLGQRHIKQPRLRHHRTTRGLLYTVDQFAQVTHFKDKTPELLDAGYWAALRGIPFHRDISEDSDKTDMASYFMKFETIGKFHKAQVNATDLSSIFYLMRNNDFYEDPPVNGDPTFSLSPRGDLEGFLFGLTPQPYGVIDTTVCEGQVGSQFVFHAVAGPTFSLAAGYDDYDDESRVLPFDWSSSIFHDLPHTGHPDKWNFPLETYNWVWTKKSTQKISK